MADLQWILADLLLQTVIEVVDLWLEARTDSWFLRYR
jgi:hypothetical protein